jgi:putative ABC transport system substrate-binding protein
VKRREFITLASGAAVAWPLAARAQQASGPPLIGALMNISQDNPSAAAFIGAFRQQLQDLGWTDGRNTRIAVRWAESGARYRDYAADLAALAPAIVLASTSRADEVIE